VSGYLAAAGSVIPFAAMLLPGTLAGYGFPPLGNIETFARIGTFLLALGTTYFAFFASSDDPGVNRKLVVRALIAAPVFLCVYLALCFLVVRTVPIPTQGTAIQVSVGYERTEFAKANFGTESDWEILRERGPDEEQIAKLWTRKSLLVSRMGLYISYLLFILTLVAGFSFGVVCEVQT
jgi:hypothetical protein